MGRGNDWCIVRTSGPKTLPLAASFNASGIDAWTPRQIMVRRRGRDRVRVEQEAPIMATFVFVRAHCVATLQHALCLPINPHPAFSIFRDPARGIPLIADREISGARAVEALATAATVSRQRAEAGEARRDAKDAMRRAMPVGERISIPTEAFAGMTGIVESSSRKEAWVILGSGFRMKIDTWLMSTNGVQDRADAA